MKPSAFDKVLPQRWMLFLRMDIKSAQILTWIYKSRHFPVQSEMFLSDSKNTVNTGKYATQYETCVFLLLKLSHQDDRTHLKRHTCPESYTPTLLSVTVYWNTANSRAWSTEGNGLPEDIMHVSRLITSTDAQITLNISGHVFTELLLNS